MKRLTLLAASLVALLYIFDTLLVHYKILKNRDPYGSVQVTRYYAVPEKNNRVEYFYTAPETRECVHALFPHGGDNPCWYAARHAEERIDE